MTLLTIPGQGCHIIRGPCRDKISFTENERQNKGPKLSKFDRKYGMERVVFSRLVRSGPLCILPQILVRFRSVMERCSRARANSCSCSSAFALFTTMWRATRTQTAPSISTSGPDRTRGLLQIRDSSVRRFRSFLGFLHLSKDFAVCQGSQM